ncbi:MAG: hypothetical protein WBD16_03685 [Pyrinomonadaceae bacterium]
MKRLFIAPLALFLLVFVTGTADAQKKSTRKTTTKKTTATRVLPPLAVRTAREKVEIQLSNVNDFVTKLGPIAQGLETADADRKAGNLSAKTAASIEASKSKLVDAIRILREGLSALESEFRVKTELKKYLPSIQGITDLAAESEDSAIAGKFVTAKEPLREVSKKLTDTLAAMPR